MKKIVVFATFFGCLNFTFLAQNSVTGFVKDNVEELSLENVKISINTSSKTTKKTDSKGFFLIDDLPNGNYLLIIDFKGYEVQKFPLEFTGEPINLGIIFLYENNSKNDDLSVITLTDDELNSDANSADNIAGLLLSSKDIFLRSAAFEFSASFFRIRGLDSENGKVLINGIEMNKIYNGRPQWSNWGGLNDVLRNQEFSANLSPSTQTFGGFLGITNISTKASEQRKGTRISYASSNRGYVHRLMIKHASGLSKNGWAYTISASRRAATEGFVDGTSYNANSFFVSVEKKINPKNSLNFTGIIAKNRRGKSAPQTQEVIDLKGIKYNSYWGFSEEGNARNSRIKEIFEPILMLNHQWKFNSKTTLNTNVSYQFGKIGNSRIDNNGTKVEKNGIDGAGNPYIVKLGASNPDPTYYQKLPSYALRQKLQNVYKIEKDFLKNGQLNWRNLYQANTKLNNEGYASYVFYEDRNDDSQLTINSILYHEFSENISLQSKINFTKLTSKNFAEIIDLLGANGYLDVDSYADTKNKKQNNLLNPLNFAGVGDTFKYNFNLNSTIFDGFVQGQFNFNKIDFFLSGSVSQTSHQRDGVFKNGRFPDTSFGKSIEKKFTNFGVKSGVTYKFSGRHLLDSNLGFQTRAPNLRNTFSNSRENNSVVENLTSQQLFLGDISYIYRSPMLQAKTTVYYIKKENATEISFFFADGIGGDNTAFVQEILSGIDQKNMGIELGFELQITPEIKLKGAGNFGQYVYANNPNIYLTTENNARSQAAGFVDGRKDFGTSYLKNYKLPAGPQTAYSLGFEYRDPSYWFVGATANFFDNIYIDIAPLTRTSNFSDNGGIPFYDYNVQTAKELLQQEKFDNYMVINMIGGKSWRVDKKYISLFLSIGNLMNTTYKTGGFEQGRNANYKQLKEDKNLEIPVFGNKYWFGRGTTYFLNLSYNF